MKNTTLCYIEKNNAYLMLLRNKKKVDENAGKWIGVGGKFEEGESPEECLLREVKEETGLTLTSYRFRGLVTFVSDEWGSEYMHLFTADTFDNSMHPETDYSLPTNLSLADDKARAKAIANMPTPDCQEGTLRWIPKDQIMDLELWEGDRAFLKLLAKDCGFFTMRLEYQGDKLIKIDQHIY